MLSEKDQPRQAFLFHRAYPPLGKRIQVRTACRQLQRLDLAGLHHLAKHRTELAVAIVQQVATVCQKAPILHRYGSRPYGPKTLPDSCPEGDPLGALGPTERIMRNAACRSREGHRGEL